ncbi:flagellar L-ring protein precursor FlgH [Paucidesulfovibrio gracilis DSM 16080]|uniref:Flagellar L-ring protein n=2 Tax=Paucidesulfovibrio TaxID=2910985 RepID=A0A1T4XAE1_9BACT|nr:flagellar L-ring protein precursor FlgH [Paucidesulfovibrio gracilis DSM 16080]
MMTCNKHWAGFFRLTVALTAFALLAGCAAKSDPTPMPVLSEPAYEEPEPMDNPGSLFTPNTAEFLYDDNRAHRVGDIVMVVVSEVTDASQKAETTTDRTSDNQYGITSLPGTDTLVGGALDTVGLQPGLSIESNNANEFEGTGETTRESELSATVASRIVRMLPGRVMQVEGARRVRVNNETQILVVRGLVRTRDIRADNSVPSSYLAEAQIELYGEGVLSDKQRPGWLTRILDNVWPF